MTREERDNAIRCIKKWAEKEPYLQTYKTCLEALEQCQVTDDVERPSCDRNICISNEYNGIGCDECICSTTDDGCQKEDIEDAIPISSSPCEEKVSIGVLKQVMWERDVAISQLNELGYGFGQKMWISVNDFLPEEHKNPITMDYYQYPVTFQNGDITDIRYYGFGEGHWWHGPEIMDKYVTAWMPIPNPCKTEKEGNKQC